MKLQTVAVVVVAIGALAAVHPRAQTQQPYSGQGALLSVAATSAQGPAVDRVMRKKLVCAQQILEAVVTSRWADLEARSRDLEDLTNEPAWRVLDHPEYSAHSSAFRQAVRTLHDAAAKRDLEATPKAYIELTMSCVECHRYLARSRMAGR